MPIRIKPEYETYDDIQIRAVNKMGMYCIAIGGLRELSTGGQEYLPRGEVYLHQELVDDDADYEKRMRDLYDKMVATGEEIPSYEELASFDGLIHLKAKYHLGKGEHNDIAILIDDVEQIPLDDQLTFDDDGNIVKASIYDDNE